MKGGCIGCTPVSAYNSTKRPVRLVNEPVTAIFDIWASVVDHYVASVDRNRHGVASAGLKRLENQTSSHQKSHTIFCVSYGNRTWVSLFLTSGGRRGLGGIIGSPRRPHNIQRFQSLGTTVTMRRSSSMGFTLITAIMHRR